VSPDDFARAMDYMLAKGIIGPGSEVIPYNFGEPFLHPQFEQIIAQLDGYGLQFGLSTNGSQLRTLRGPVLKNLNYLTFSMPGFSQASYDRIHGLDFETVKANIVAIHRNARECGFAGNAYISFHIYQFNLDEIEQAFEFAADHGILFHAYYAFFNDLGMYLDYLESTMPYAQLRRASQDLLLHHIDGLRAAQPPGFECPNREDLTLNERCQVVLCCMVDKNEGCGVLGDLFGMSLDEIREARAGHDLCRRCLSSGCAYLFSYRRRVRPTSHPSADGTVYSITPLAGVVFKDQPASCAGYIEAVSPSGHPNSLMAEGWARDPVADGPPEAVLLLDDTRKVIAWEQVNLRRRDVAPAGGFDPVRMRYCGWRVRFQRDRLSPGAQYLIGYAFNVDDKIAYRMANKMRLP